MKGTLKRWWDKASQPERLALAEAVGSSVQYLYQHATGRRQNPKLRLALAIVEHAAKIGGRRLPRVTLEGLAWTE